MQPFTPSITGTSRAEASERGGMAVIDRLTVLLSAAVSFAVGLGLLAVGLFGWDVTTLWAGWGYTFDPEARVGLTAAGAGLVLLGAAAVRPAISRPGGDRAIVRATGLGEVHISMRAIQTLARRAASQVRGIREADVQVLPAATGDVNVRLALTVAPDESIPELCDAVQTRIDQYLRQTAGVSCGQIRLIVRGIAREGRPSRPE